MILVATLVGASTASAVIVRLNNGKSISYQPTPRSWAGGGAGARASHPFDKLFSNLDYNGGPVMPSNTNYALYWDPNGGPAYPSGYQSGLNRFFADLAHDSGGHENVDSVSSQYNDAAGAFASYSSHFGTALIDEDPYPANGCTRAPICLTDAQIQAELTKYVAEHELPTDVNHEYFVLTPGGVEDCFEANGKECSAGVTEPEFRAYCAYHSNIALKAGGQLIYANDPFVTGNPACDDGNHPNGSPSDGALIGGLSHEHNESITDPEPNSAWADFGSSAGEEIGDKCRTFEASTEYGTPLGTANGATYNQVINGHFYWYQQEWSNKGHSCLQRLTFATSEAPTAIFTSKAGSGNEVKFSASGSTAGEGVQYNWQFNEKPVPENTPVETESPAISHTFPRAGTYAVALTVFKSDGSSSGTAQTVTAGKTQTIKVTSSAPGAATVGGPAYVPAATSTSGLPVAFTIDPTSASICSISGATVSFVGVGTCTLDANQAGNVEYNPAPQVQQAFPVGRGSQSITFTSSPPPAATDGGPPYAVAATASSGLAATFSAATPSVCTVSGSTVSFVGIGTCTIDADQAGDANYEAAPQAQQSFAVGASAAAGGESISLPPGPVFPPGAGSTFGLLSAAVNERTGAITFTGSLVNAGTFSWLLTFQNGRFGVFASANAKCGKGFITLRGKCRPARIVFARGSRAVGSAGTVSFTVKPTRLALSALRRALRQKRGLPVLAVISFRSSAGGAPASYSQALIVRLTRR